MNNSPCLNYEYNLTSKQIFEKVVKFCTCLNWTCKNGGKIKNHIFNKYWPMRPMWSLNCLVLVINTTLNNQRYPHP